MKKINLILAFVFTTSLLFAQYDYESSTAFPYGKINPKAPKQIKDYEELIGVCNCKSTTKGQDGKWKKEVNMIWKYKYIMNGMAIQDETLKEDGSHSGSIRQFDKDSLRWNVHFYSTTGTPKTLQSWQGNRDGDKMKLYRKTKAPNGADGYYRITFYDITKLGFNWIGEWVNLDETITFPLWKIVCHKRIE